MKRHVEHRAVGHNHHVVGVLSIEVSEWLCEWEQEEHGNLGAESWSGGGGGCALTISWQATRRGVGQGRGNSFKHWRTIIGKGESIPSPPPRLVFCGVEAGAEPQALRSSRLLSHLRSGPGALWLRTAKRAPSASNGDPCLISLMLSHACSTVRFLAFVHFTALLSGLFVACAFFPHYTTK